MSDTRINDFVSSGTAAERAAFTPAPPTPASGNDPGYVWAETDTHQVYVSDGSTAFRAGYGLKGSDIASAGTISIGAADYYHVTGTTTITDIDFSPDHSGRGAWLVFDGALTLTHHATTLILPTGANITTAAGDSCYVVSENGTDNVRVVLYQRKDGTAVAGGAFTAASTTEQLTGTSTTKGSTPDSVAALWEKGSDVASAGTISLGEGGFFHITGTTTITDIDFGTDKSGRSAILVFDGALTLTHNATTLILPTGANITTAAGDACCVVSEDGTDNVRVVWYQRKDGTALASSATQQLFPTFTTPNDGDFSWDNQGGATVTVNGNGSIALDAPSSASVNVRLRYKAISGSAPYTVAAMFTFNHRQDTQRYGGLVFRQNDGKFVALIIDGTRVLHVYKFNSTTSFDSDVASATIPAYHFLWLRIVDDNTNRSCQWSLDGYTWQVLFSETRTTFITATQYGIMAVDHANTANQKAVTTLYSLSSV